MKLADFIILVTMKNKGGYELPGGDETTKWDLLIEESIKAVIDEEEPIDLSTTDTNYSVYKWIDGEWFIREPKRTSSNNDELDIDEQLVYAVLYDLLMRYNVPDADFYQSERNIAIFNFALMKENGLSGVTND